MVLFSKSTLKKDEENPFQTAKASGETSILVSQLNKQCNNFNCNANLTATQSVGHSHVHEENPLIRNDLC